MANDWTRLLQETSKHGGPDALKAYYANRGRMEGAGGMLLIAAGIGLLVKASRSFAKGKTIPETLGDNPEPGASNPAVRGKSARRRRRKEPKSSVQDA
jgi:hypothetical protein